MHVHYLVHKCCGPNCCGPNTTTSAGTHRWRQNAVKGMPEKSPCRMTFQLPSIPEPLASVSSALGP